MDAVFERFVLREAERANPHASTGRPRAISDECALRLIFRVLRTGMQWREVACDVSHTTDACIHGDGVVCSTPHTDGF